MVEKLRTYDPAEDLTSDEAVAQFMVDAHATEDAGYIIHALGVVARAKAIHNSRRMGAAKRNPSPLWRGRN